MAAASHKWKKNKPEKYLLNFHFWKIGQKATATKCKRVHNLKFFAKKRGTGKKEYYMYLDQKPQIYRNFSETEHILFTTKPNMNFYFIIHEIETQKVIRMTSKLFKRIYKWGWKSDDQKGYIIDGLLPDSLNCIVFISNREIITCPKPIVLKYVKYHATFLKHISEFYFSCSFCHPREQFCENLYIWPFLTTINVGTLDAINFDTPISVLNVELEAWSFFVFQKFWY